MNVLGVLDESGKTVMILILRRRERIGNCVCVMWRVMNGLDTVHLFIADMCSFWTSRNLTPVLGLNDSALA